MKSERGYSLLEMLMVCALTMVLGGMAVGVAQSFVTTSRSDSSMKAVVKQLELVRNRAIAERRNFQITFINGNQIRVSRMEQPPPAVTIISTDYLQNGLNYRKYIAMPDTPDAFGNAVAINFSGPQPVMFTSDGSLLDANGFVTNGTILFGQGANQRESARALTIFGTTGLVRTWKWVGTAWGN